MTTAKKISFRVNESLAKHTSLGVGGPADYFIETKTEKDLIKVVLLAREKKINFLILGGGTNIIASDKGYRGLVIKNLFKTYSTKPFKNKFTSKKINFRLTQLEPENYLKAPEKKSRPEQKEKKYLVNAGSGWRINALISRCLADKLTGLEYFAGIPGSLGGAVYMNIHGGREFISRYVYQVKMFDPEKNIVKTLDNNQLDFSYDHSIFHNRKWIILSVYLILTKEKNPKQSIKIQQQWLKEKLAIQPQRSAGSVWQNLSISQTKKLNLPTSGIGYFIDKKLGLKGMKIGKAQISPKHAGFIENLGSASAADVLKLIALVEKKARKVLGINLQREVILIGEQ